MWCTTVPPEYHTNDSPLRFLLPLAATCVTSFSNHHPQHAKADRRARKTRLQRPDWRVADWRQHEAIHRLRRYGTLGHSVKILVLLTFARGHSSHSGSSSVARAPFVPPSSFSLYIYFSCSSFAPHLLLIALCTRPCSCIRPSSISLLTVIRSGFK